MKTREQALKYGLSFPDTYQDAPFRDDNWQLVRYRGNKKAFLWIYEKDGYVNLNVKSDPDKAFFCVISTSRLFRDITRTSCIGTLSSWMAAYLIMISRQ